MLLVIALARLLEPADFGLFSILMVVNSALQIATLDALGQSVIRSERQSIGDFVFTLQLLTSIGLSILLVAIAPLVASLFGKPELLLPLRVSCLLLVLSPLLDTAIRLNIRAINFRVVFLRRVVGPLSNATVSIPLAMNGYAHWALIWGQIAGLLASTVVVLVSSSWIPRINLQFAKFATDLSFSGQMLIQGTVRWIRSQSDRALLGPQVSAAELGKYDLARRLASIPFAAIVEPASQVIYPLMAEQVRRGEPVAEIYLVAQRRLLTFTLPLSFFLIFNAEAVIEIVFGSRWIDISGIFIVASAIGGLYSLVGINKEVFKALDRPQILTKFMLVRAVATLLAFAMLATLGTEAVVVGALCLAAIFTPINIYLTTRILGLPTIKFLSSSCARPLTLCAILAGSYLATSKLQLSNNSLLFLNVAVSAAVILIALYRYEKRLLLPSRHLGS